MPLPVAYKQEYIIKERREYRMCQYSALNVCSELLAWNANYSTTIFKYVIIYKHHWTNIRGGTVIIDIPSIWLSTYIQRTVEKHSIPSSLFYYETVLLLEFTEEKRHPMNTCTCIYIYRCPCHLCITASHLLAPTQKRHIRHLLSCAVVGVCSSTHHTLQSLKSEGQ